MVHATDTFLGQKSHYVPKGGEAILTAWSISLLPTGVENCGKVRPSLEEFVYTGFCRRIPVIGYLRRASVVEYLSRDTCRGKG